MFNSAGLNITLALRNALQQALEYSKSPPNSMEGSLKWRHIS
jgi:hypothetical protein